MNKLERAIHENANFLAIMRYGPDLSRVGDKDAENMMSLLQSVAALKPAVLKDTADGYYAVANFYDSLGKSIRGNLNKREDVWNGGSGASFHKFFKELRLYIADGADERSLMALARATAGRMNGVAKAIDEWQGALAKIIRKYAKIYDDSVNSIRDNVADFFSLDFRDKTSNLLKLLNKSIGDTSDNYQSAITGEAEAAGAEVEYQPLNSQRLAGRTFERDTSDFYDNGSQ